MWDNVPGICSSWGGSSGIFTNPTGVVGLHKYRDCGIPQFWDCGIPQVQELCDPQIQGFAGIVGFIRSRDCGIPQVQGWTGIVGSSHPGKNVAFLGNPDFPWEIVAFLGKS